MRKSAHQSTRRGGVYPLVLIVCAAGAAAALTGLTIRQATDNRSAAIGELASARLLARSGIEASLQVIEENDAWRTDFGVNETLTYSLAPGSVDVLLTDESDGDLSDDANDAYTLTSVATVGTAKATLRTTVVVDADSYRSRVLAAGPLRYWPLDETSGFTATDITGNDNASHTNPNALNGMKGYDGLPAPLMDSTMSLAFETHTTDYLITSGTIMCWVYCIGDKTGDQTILSKNRGNGEEGDFDLTLVGPTLEITASIVNRKGTQTLSLGTLKPETWTHIAVSFGADGFTGFVDGVETAFKNVWTGWESNTHNLEIGVAVRGTLIPLPTQSINGSVRDVAIFDYGFTWRTVPPLLEDTTSAGIDPESWVWIVD